jgi:hypothetical protein
VTDLSRELELLVPPFDDADADWAGALLLGGREARRPLALTLVAAVLAVAVLAAASFGNALAGRAFDRLSAWVGAAPGAPAPEEEARALREANARSAAPIPRDTELGLLVSRSLKGVEFELLGFRDRGSLCLRLRSSAPEKGGIVKAPANCVSEQLLADLGKPVAVFAAADPFPRRAKPGLQALYGLAADGVDAVALKNERGVVRVPVENNAFLFLYQGEGPRLTNSRLDYRSDVPARAIALNTAGRALGSIEIMSLKRGYPGGPAAAQLPGPDVVDRPITSPRVGWLDRGESRGQPYEWPWPDGGVPEDPAQLRIFQPSPMTSLRVAVWRTTTGAARHEEPAYCLMHVWPLQPRPTGFMCTPLEGRGRTVALATTTAVFDAQFPVYYGLASDDVTALQLVLANGARETIPVADNVFAFQTSSAEPAKLVGYDSESRVVLIRVVTY